MYEEYSLVIHTKLVPHLVFPSIAYRPQSYSKLLKGLPVHD